MSEPVPYHPITPDLAYPSRQPGGDAARSHSRSRSVRTLSVIVAGALVVVIGAAVTVALAADSAAIHDGPGTAVFTWTPVDNPPATGSDSPPQPFTASVNGHDVNGSATTVFTASAGTVLGGNSSEPVPVFRYTGHFAGQPFSLVLSFAFPRSAVATSAVLEFTVVGTYGQQRVAGSITAPVAGPTSGAPAHLTGRIGHWKIAADIPPSTGTSTSRSATVHYVVSG